MNQRISTVIYPVKDVTAAKAIYTKLMGSEPYVDTSYYVGYRVGDIEFGLDPHGHDQGLTGPACYVEVADIKQTVQTLVAGGAQIQRDVQDVGGGKLIAWLKDADGNIFGVIQSPS